jgi:hypothetical protein
MTQAAITESIAVSENDLFLKSLEFLDEIRFHEAGHSVAARIFGFPVKRIWVGTEFDPNSFGRNELDPRGLHFLEGYVPRTAGDAVRMADFATFAIAGIAAESKYSGVPFEEVRAPYIKGETHSEDYVIVNSMARRLIVAGNDGVSDEQAYISQWEQRAIGLMNQTHVWSAVESVVSALQLSDDGALDRANLNELLSHLK